MAQEYRNTLGDIKRVLQKGIKRPLPSGKENVHYGEYTALVKLFASLGVDPGLYLEDITLEKFYEQSSKVLAEFTRKLLQTGGPVEQLNQTYGYLSEQDPLEKSDIIFVFGGSSLSRPEKAAKLYQAGYAPMIYCSGSRPIEEDNREHEGRKFKDFLVTNFGIDSSVIISDPNENSLSMVENVKGFLNYCDETGLKIKRIIFVIQEHNLRRAWAIFMKHTENIQLIRCSCGQEETVNKDIWYKSPIGIKLVYEEYEKIKIQRILNSG